MKTTNDLSLRLYSFAVDVILYLRAIPDNSESRIIKHQLIKAATSAGANYEESQAGVSRREFSMKVGISLKETRESNYWLRIIKGISTQDDKMLESLLRESEELKAILGSIVSKIRTDLD